ncbi:MAG: bifunctional 2-C-methyl-D-erythritol 4-phosphate cytidylyltransferase/2-C-methyl-D-erythritol 2,4-cyclodiphosphate synthase [Sulfurospirillum sp.]|nr:bifunctional 2-C-methyl-D-erythritol 4-phosphate cytidylyltransferase/2-C-methyl-D-erythritol 2,4-cyclodiphosphate synthase [Sulfurospirillum sp.]
MLSAGSSTRFGGKVKKHWLRIAHTPLWLYATNQITACHNFAKVIVVCSPDEIRYARLFNEEFTFIVGGASRQESLQNALLHVSTSRVLISDVARACVDASMLERIFCNVDADCIVPYLPISDTVVYCDETIDRTQVKRIQTPQLSKTAVLKKAMQTTQLFTDESSAIKAIGGTVHFVLGSHNAHKLTFAQDMQLLAKLPSAASECFVGNGFDVHAFEEKKTMWLGGVKIRDDIGFKAHSDGDVAIHALIDALLGASGAGDIGELFPDTDASFKNIDSKILLQKVVTFLGDIGFDIINCDITILAQKPKLQNFKMQMRKTLATLLQIDILRVNIKATTTEKLGFIGREEGVGVIANASIKYHDWKTL